MIYIGCGVIMFVIGVIWLIAPSPNPNRIYGYMSYLASVNEASYQYAQKVARNYFILFGLIQTLLGLGIHFFALGSLLFNLDAYFLFVYLGSNNLN